MASRGGRESRAASTEVTVCLGAISLLSFFLGLDDLRVLAIDEHDGESFVLVESIFEREFCCACRVRAGSKGRKQVGA